MATDFYVVLGLGVNASGEQIKTAYTVRARECCPDGLRPDPQEFQAVQEAYSVLANPTRRRAYDTRTQRGQQTSARPQGEPMRAEIPGRREAGVKPIEFSVRTSEGEFRPSYEELFERLWSNFNLNTRPKEESIQSLTIEIPIKREEAMAGGRAHIKVPSRVQCSTCAGQGAVAGYQCWKCQGQGAVIADATVEVAYPAGIRNEHMVQVGLEQFGIGNFYLLVRFRVEG